MKSEKGQAMVEFALVLPLLMIIILGIVGFGSVYADYLQINNYLRTSSRTLTISSVKADSFNQLNELITSEYENVLITYSPDQDYYESGDLVKISVAYQQKIIFPLFNEVKLNVENVVSIE